MAKKISIHRDWRCYPLWVADGKIPVNTDPADLPISKPLRERINAWSKVMDDCWDVIDGIPGGGWSYHSREEFDTSRQKLGISFPNSEADHEEGAAIWRELQRELGGMGYEITYDETPRSWDDY